MLGFFFAPYLNSGFFAPPQVSPRPPRSLASVHGITWITSSNGALGAQSQHKHHWQQRPQTYHNLRAHSISLRSGAASFAAASANALLTLMLVISVALLLVVLQVIVLALLAALPVALPLLL